MVLPSGGFDVEGMIAYEAVVLMAPNTEGEAALFSTQSMIFVVEMGQDLDGGNSRCCQQVV